MIYKLLKKKHPIVNKLVNKSCISVQLQSVIAGKNQGDIYVDSINNPNSALVFHKGESGFFFIGDPHNKAFNQEIQNFIYTNLKGLLAEQKINTFEFSGDSPKWDSQFEKLFKDTQLSASTQHIYLSDDIKIIPSPLPETYTIKQINKNIFLKNNYTNISFLTDEILNWWYSLEDFLSVGMSFMALDDNKIIGRCLIDGYSDSIKAIGIATDIQYRKKGIASALASTMINWNHKHGITSYWECSSDNIPSNRLAKNCGLKLSFSYKVYFFNY